MTESLTDLLPGGPGDPAADTGWQPLPRRSRALFLLDIVPVFAIPGALVGGVFGGLLDQRWLGGLLLLLVAGGFGTWLAMKRYRNTTWRLDAHGFAVRRGRFWQRETRVPASRVQHLDIKRGPLQRRRDLATLVVHTAGTANSAVSLPNLDLADAERLRDLLGRQIEHDDA
ncbi:MAG TPA: PH domain-containing protein [Xanthomonadaceae bacterium]|nr:PH domain-containing protein [Xanthomonadaceae bacterium]